MTRDDLIAKLKAMSKDEEATFWRDVNSSDEKKCEILKLFLGEPVTVQEISRDGA